MRETYEIETTSGHQWHSPIVGAEGEPEPLVNIVVAGTLLDVARLVTTLLRLTYPDVGAKTDRITELVRFTARRLELEQSWEFEVAARLSQIGYLGLDPELVAAWKRGETLTEEHHRALVSHPLIARDLLSEVTRLDTVREMIARQSEPFTVPGGSVDPVATRDRVELGGQLLHACAAFDDHIWTGLAGDAAAGLLSKDPCEFDPEIVAALGSWAAASASRAA
jgi:hypothetical protein